MGEWYTNRGIPINGIFKFNEDNNTLTPLYLGYLNFENNSKIDCLASYENEEIQKVYWVDGVNSPRCINVAAPENVRNTWTDTSFDFIPVLNLNEKFTVTKLSQYGSFEPGTIQYCFTYYDKNGRESNIVDVSPLMYITEPNGKGAAADKLITNTAFEIIINDFNWELGGIDGNTGENTEFSDSTIYRNGKYIEVIPNTIITIPTNTFKILDNI